LLDKESLNKELIDKELDSEELLEKELLNKELRGKQGLDKELPDKEVPLKMDEAPAHRWLPREIIRKWEEDKELDELIKRYEDTLKKPTAKLAPYLLEAAVRRIRMTEENNASEGYVNMLKEKSQASRMWYEVSDWLDQDGVAAVTMFGSCQSAGSAGHGKKCKAIEKKLKGLDPGHAADRNTLERLFAEVRKLMPWTASLRRRMVEMQDELLSTQ